MERKTPRAFKLFGDWLQACETEGLKIHPVMHDAYKLFIYIAITVGDGDLTLDKLKSKCRRFGLRNAERIDAAIHYMLVKDIICSKLEFVDEDMAREHLEAVCKGKHIYIIGDDIDLYKEIHQHKRAMLEKGTLTVRCILNEFAGAASARKGFKIFDASILHYPNLRLRSGRLLQLYVYFILAGSIKDKYVALQEEWLTHRKVKVHTGECLVGFHTLAGKFNVSTKSVRDDIGLLIKGGLISRRKSHKGRSYIYQVINYVNLQKYKAF